MTTTFLKRVTAVAFVALLACTGVSNGQSSRLSIGAEIGMPMGDFADFASTGFGGSLRFEMPMGDNLGLMGTAGYISFSGKDEAPSWGMVPIQLGAKYYFSEQQKGFYASLELGVHMSMYTVPGQDAIVIGGVTYAAATEDETESSTDLSYAPALGYHLDNLDFGLRYQIVATEGSSLSYLGLRVAYVLGGN